MDYLRDFDASKADIVVVEAGSDAGSIVNGMNSSSVGVFYGVYSYRQP